MEKGEASTTMVFARLLSKLLRDKSIGRRIVPIIPDEARTFGMDALFSQVGIYSALGQLYEPVDKGKLLYYRESKDGQVLEEGITEAGSMASFQAAATSYATHGQPMIPFYIFYSMFGFQRTGDQMWQVGRRDGARLSARRDGGPHHAERRGPAARGRPQPPARDARVPSCVAYDVAFAYELAAIIEDGLRRMLDEDENVYYYITLQNESYAMPAMPRRREARASCAASTASSAAEATLRNHVQLFGSGSILNEVLARADSSWPSASTSPPTSGASRATSSFGATRSACERCNRLHPEQSQRVPYVVACARRRRRARSSPPPTT